MIGDKALTRREFGQLIAAAGTAALTPTAVGATALSSGGPTWFLSAVQEGGRGGTLVFARNADAVTLDPQHSFQGIALHVLYCIYDTLTAVHPVTQEVEGVLAESWDISDDGLEYTFHLCQGIRFHDGTPFTSEAITFAFERILGEASATASASWVSAVTEAVAVDDYTVKLLLSEPFSPLLGNLASGYFGIPSPTAVREMGDAFGQNPVGTGRWKFREWLSGERITLVPNEDCRNFRSNSVNKGAPMLEQLVFRSIPEAETQLAALETGEVSMIYPPEREVQRLQEDPTYEVIISPNSDGTTYIEFAMDEPPDGEFGALFRGPFDDLRVRQAVAYGVNADELIEKVFYGLADRNYGPMPTGLFPFKPEIEEFGYHHDPEKANALLEEAGWIDSDGDGVREKDGASLEVLFWAGASSANERLTQILQSQLAQVGFKVNLELVESGTFLARLPENVSNFNLLGWGQPEPDMLRGMTNGTWGLGRYRDEQYQSLVTQALQTTDHAERTEFYFQAAQKMLADAAMVPLWTNLAVIATRAEVEAYKIVPFYFNMGVLDDVYIEE